MTFTVEVPEDASPGDHPGGIVTSYATEGSGTVRLDRRLGSRIHVRVAGEQRVSMTVTDVTVAQSSSLNPLAPLTTTVRYSLSNTGNVRTLGHETVTLSGPGGIAAVSAEAVVDEIMPGGSLTREVTFEGTWPLGRLGADVQISPEAVAGQVAAPVQAGAATWAVPWVLLGALVLLIAVAVWLGVRRGRRAPEQATRGTGG